MQTDAIRQPKLAEAILSAPDTLMDCLSVCAASGLMPGSAHGQFYLIPRWSSKRQRMEATFIVGYKGLCDIAYRHPRVASVQAMLVFKGEEFHYNPGEGTIHHLWNGDVARDSLDDIVAGYAKVELATPSGHHAGGKPLIRVLTQKDILRSKARSETGKKGFGPWIDDPIPMAQRVPLRRILSDGSVPRQYELIHLLGKESEAEEVDEPTTHAPNAGGVAGLKAQLSVVEEIPDDPDAQRAMLSRLRPDEDPSMLSDADVLEQLKQARS